MVVLHVFLVRTRALWCVRAKSTKYWQQLYRISELLRDIRKSAKHRRESRSHALDLQIEPQIAQLVSWRVRNLFIRIDLSRVANLDSNKSARNDDLELLDNDILLQVISVLFNFDDCKGGQLVEFAAENKTLLELAIAEDNRVKGTESVRE